MNRVNQENNLKNQEYTHKELVSIACRWLQNTKKCSLVYAEPGGMVLSEQPDALGFTGGGTRSHVIECKTSRSDFLKDKKKPFRHPELGMGRHRWFLTPPGLIRPEELPEAWGLLYASGNRVTVVSEAPFRLVHDVHQELNWLYCVARRQMKGVPFIKSEYRFESLVEKKKRDHSKNA